VPISEPGDWTFRVVSKAIGATVDIGKPSEPVTFVTPSVTPGVIGWLAARHFRRDGYMLLPIEARRAELPQRVENRLSAFIIP
jgi:hypothetical protein